MGRQQKCFLFESAVPRGYSSYILRRPLRFDEISKFYLKLLSRASASKKVWRFRHIFVAFSGQLDSFWASSNRKVGFFRENFLRWSILFQLEFSFSLQWALREKLRWRTQNFCGTACFWSSESSENWKNEEFKITVEQGIACFRRPYDFFYCFSSILITLLALFHNTYILLFFIFNLGTCFG